MISDKMKQTVDKYTNEAIQKYESRTKKSKETFEKAKRFLPGGNSRRVVFWKPYPTYFAKGKGFTIFDIDGNNYVDFINNLTSLIHGHAHPKIIKAIEEVMQTGTAIHWPTEHEIKLAKLLCERFPSFERVRFTNSGTEATLNAIRLARGFMGKSKIMKAEGAYHGNHDCVEVSVEPELSKAGPIEHPTPVLESGTQQSVTRDTVIFPFNNKEITERIFKENKDELAAVIVEPLQRSIPPKDEFLEFLRDLTAENDVLLVFDEVISGRVSKGGVQEYYGVTPDLTAIGKIFGGGLPFGGFGGREDIMMLMDPSRKEKSVGHAGTFNANPMTMAAGVAATEMLTPSVFEQLDSLGKYLRKNLNNVLEETGTVAQLTGLTSLLTIHFTNEEVTDYRSSSRARKDLYPPLHLQMLNHGVSLEKRMFCALSTVMTKKEIDFFTDAFRESIEWLKPCIEVAAPNLITRN